VIIDLHNHTIPLSRDSTLEPISLISRVASLGIDGVCLTEHDAAWDSKEVQEIAAAYGIVVIPGMEVTTEIGHILVFGLDRYQPEMASMRRLAEIATSEGAAMILAHPHRSSAYSNYWTRSDESYGSLNFDFAIHGVEIFNGRGSQSENMFSAKVAHSLQLPGTGGSDAHHLVEIGECVTEFEDVIDDLDSLLGALRSGRMVGRMFKEGRLGHS
jgi:predicted metal-dependent phosphoesterase TrpH